LEAHQCLSTHNVNLSAVTSGKGDYPVLGLVEH